MKFEIKQLRLQNIDELRYKSWNHEQILIWFMSLENGRFKKYFDILAHNLSQEDVNGNDLKNVDVLDIKSWGVINFGDKKSLLSHIKKLVNNVNKE